MTTALDPSPAGASVGIDQLQVMLNHIDQLPTLPAVACRLLETATSEGARAADLSALIENDPSLTAKILSLARRSHLGTRAPTTVQQAVVVLGFRAVRNAVLCVKVFETLGGASAAPGAELATSLWKHSLATACAATLIAEAAGAKDLGGEAFVGGLLHDIGKLALLTCVPKSYVRVVRRTEERRVCIVDAERELLGVDHTVAGKRLAVRWGLPEAIVSVIWLHHQTPEALPTTVDAGHLVRIVHLADHLVRRLRIGCSGYHRTATVEALAGVPGIDGARLEQISTQIPLDVEAHGELIGLNDVNAAGLYAEALADANRELGRINTELAEANRRFTIRERVFDALTGFTGSVVPEAGLADVWLAAAECVRRLLAVSSAIGFTCHGQQPVLHLGISSAGGGRTDVVPFEPAGCRALHTFWPGKPTTLTGGLVEAAGLGRVVAELYAATDDHRPWWMFPVVRAGRAVGAVAFPAEHESLQEAAIPGDEWDTLADAMALAASFARMRASAERTSEELADAGRRLHDAREEVSRVRSLAMVAQMAAGAAHELNTPLAVVSGRAQLLVRSAVDEEQRRDLNTIHEQCLKCSEIVSELVDFAKPAAPQPQAVQVGPWLERLRQHWRARHGGQSARITVKVSDAMLRLHVDVAQADRILEALLDNAVLAAAESDGQVLINCPGPTSDETAVISVEDHGAGMSAEVLEHAVDPFFSHRPAGRARGLGLSRAYRLAENNGGRLWLESSPGHGTRAFVELPVFRDSCAEERVGTPAPKNVYEKSCDEQGRDRV